MHFLVTYYLTSLVYKIMIERTESTTKCKHSAVWFVFYHLHLLILNICGRFTHLFCGFHLPEICSITAYKVILPEPLWLQSTFMNSYQLALHTIILAVIPRQLFSPILGVFYVIGS